jgi:hypothetical protein
LSTKARWNHLSQGRNRAKNPPTLGRQRAYSMTDAAVREAHPSAADKGGHSPFTQALLDNITQPGVEIQQAMTMVRAQVHELTNDQQLPWGNGNLVRAVYLNPIAPACGPRH